MAQGVQGEPTRRVQLEGIANQRPLDGVDGLDVATAGVEVADWRTERVQPLLQPAV